MSPDGRDLVFYDGGCGLCHGAVTFLVKRDADGSRFLFAPLHGPTFEERLPVDVQSSLPDSIVLHTPEGEVLTRTRAVRRMLSRLSAPYRFLGTVSRVLPLRVADALYDGVAQVRSRIFAKPAGACPILPTALRARFLP